MERPSAAAAELVAYLKDAGLTLVTAESCTSGLIAASLAEVADCGEVLEGGFVVYSPEAKQILLGIPEHLLDEVNLTSEAMARAMALGALERSPASAALADTGLAGPDAKDGIAPGTLCFAWAFRTPGEYVVFSRTERFPGEPSTVRRQAADWAMSQLERFHRQAGLSEDRS
ncbi:Nicotinamide-nucleotide amidohydrolase PncC [compost metagenome]|uniref:Amidohydrolase, PncC family n=1 Tax=Pseudomonas jinjuensis TaxID=198616 RepID=A0A1H0LGG1_9PSED|nr:CinA family protein [Pseudomonas jinjuensis]SDO67317.1 amidohydrolase, PncC family [Pseudomonas jinjuensis]